ncbi:hypothetical protein [Altererythrobacter sp. MTPC7]|uniref:hypothetical protein n=1 Tax=Altererythrobacter sp. MTPC7 TaxID=3056567 RepID=UPI0036F1A677
MKTASLIATCSIAASGLAATAFAATAMGQEYRQARPYPGVDTPAVRAPVPAKVETSAPVRSRGTTGAGTPERYRLQAPVQAAFSGPAANASNWEIGPVIRGKSRSPGMPLRPTQQGSANAGGWSFDFPYPRPQAGHVHYVTAPASAMQVDLADARRITMTYRIDAAPGTQFHPQEYPGTPATLSLYFQVRGDNWSGRDQYRFARWYSPADKVVRLRPGTHTVSIDLDDNWAAVTAFTRDRAPGEFRRSLENAARIGFTLGGKGGRGHGVYATGPARFTVLDFRTE